MRGICQLNLGFLVTENSRLEYKTSKKDIFFIDGKKAYHTFS